MRRAAKSDSMMGRVNGSVSRARLRRFASGLKYLVMLVVVAALALGQGAVGRAQDDEGKKAKKAKAAPKAAAPKAGNGDKAAKGPAGKAVEPDLSMPRTDSAVEAILDSKPASPGELLRAAHLLSRLDRPDLAKQMLAQLMKEPPDEAGWTALVEQFGSAPIVAMASRADLQPEARQVADAALKAANSATQDAKRVAALVEQARAGTPAARQQAVAGLLAAREAAIAPVVSALAASTDAATQESFHGILVELGPKAVSPVLLGMLESHDASTAAAAATVLARMGDRSLAPFLFAPALAASSDPTLRQAAMAALAQLINKVPDSAEASALLARRARDYLAGKQRMTNVVDGQVRVWGWDEAAKAPAGRMVSEADGARNFAARFARDAARLAPADGALLRLRVLTMLEAAAFVEGLDKPLPNKPGTPAAEAAACDLPVLNDVLVEAMSSQHYAAAAAVARVLGQKGPADGVLQRGPKPAPLVAALRQGDWRLRMAAAEAIVALGPAQPFPGCTCLVEALNFVAAAGSSPRVLIGSPRTEDSLTTYAGLANLGYQLEAAAFGREWVRMAALSPDYEFVVLDPALDRPVSEFAIQELRRDPRTARLPVLVAGRADSMVRAEHIARQNSLAIAMPRPHDPQAIADQARQVLALEGPNYVPHALRRQHAAVAMLWLAELSRDKPWLFDLGQTQSVALAALTRPGLSASALEVVEKLGTPESQRAMVTLIGGEGVSPEFRQSVLAAFGRSRRAFGLLLTSDEILQQYDRYNATPASEKINKKLLTGLLDVFEAGRAAPAKPAPQLAPKKVEAPKAAPPAEEKPEAPKAAEPAPVKPAPAAP